MFKEKIPLMVLLLLGLTSYMHSTTISYVDDGTFCDEIVLVFPDPNTPIPAQTIRIDKIEFLYNATIFNENLVSTSDLENSIKLELQKKFGQNLTVLVEIFHDITNNQWLLKTSISTETTENGPYVLNYDDFINLINSNTWKSNIAQIASNNGMSLNVAVEETKITVSQDLISQAGTEKLTICYYQGFILLNGNCEYVVINLGSGDIIVSTQVPELTTPKTTTPSYIGVYDYTFIIDWKADQLSGSNPDPQQVQSGLINGLSSTSILNAVRNRLFF